MAISWGKSQDGAFKLGYTLTIDSQTSTSASVRLKIYVWTKYATYDYNNTFRITGDWTFSGDAEFNVKTNSAWSSNNIAKIYDVAKTFQKQFVSYSVDFSASLTGVEYPSYSNKEYVSGRILVPAKQYSAPGAPTNISMAYDQSLSSVELSWTNPSSGTSTPYTGIYVDVERQNNGVTTAQRVVLGTVTGVSIPVVANTRYKFSVSSFNRDKETLGGSTEYLYTVPILCDNVIVTDLYVSGTTSPRTQSVALGWTYADTENIDHFVVSATDITVDFESETATIDGLLAGTEYDIGVRAVSKSGIVGPMSTVHVKTQSVPSSPKYVLVSDLNVTGTTEPRSSSVVLSWPYVAGALYYNIVCNGNLYTSSTTNITIHGVVPGINEVKVFAVNSVGDSEPAVTIVRAPGLPGPPTIRRFTPVPDGLDVEITAGDSNGRPISGYQYRLMDGSTQVVGWTNVSSLRFKISAPPGPVYVIQMRSINVVGTGGDTSSLSSDAAGGRVQVWDGEKFLYGFVKTSAGNALVRVYNGSSWVLTPQ